MRRIPNTRQLQIPPIVPSGMRIIGDTGASDVGIDNTVDFGEPKARIDDARELANVWR